MNKECSFIHCFEDIEGLKRPTLTIALIVEAKDSKPQRFHLGFSHCSALDLPNRKVGNSIAFSRALAAKKMFANARPDEFSIYRKSDKNGRLYGNIMFASIGCKAAISESSLVPLGIPEKFTAARRKVINLIENYYKFNKI